MGTPGEGVTAGSGGPQKVIDGTWGLWGSRSGGFLASSWWGGEEGDAHNMMGSR